MIFCIRLLFIVIMLFCLNNEDCHTVIVNIVNDAVVGCDVA